MRTSTPETPIPWNATHANVVMANALKIITIPVANAPKENIKVPPPTPIAKRAPPVAMLRRPAKHRATGVRRGKHPIHAKTVV